MTFSTPSGDTDQQAFIPTTGIKAIERMAMNDWQETTPEGVAQHFGELPEGTTVQVRQYAQLGHVFAVTTEGVTKYYDLSHGDPNFPEGKAVERQ